jgi:predicted dehydrogenase
VDPRGWRHQPHISGGGLFWDLGSHALDLFDFWLGPLNRVAGHMLPDTDNPAIEARVAMTAVGAGGASLSASWDFAAVHPTDCVLIACTHAEIECSVFGPAEILVRRGHGAIEAKTFEVPAAIQQCMIENIIDSLRHGKMPLSTGRSALRTNTVIDQVAASIA